MASFEYEVVGKEVVFDGDTLFPLKLFDVAGDIMARVVPVVKSPLNEEGVVFFFQDATTSDMSENYHYPVTSDLYVEARWELEGEEVAGTLTGTVVFYCIFAPLSVGSGVEGE